MDEETDMPLPPRKGDVLYGKGVPSDWSNAHVNITWADPKAGYIEGYRRGARLLVEHVNEHGRDQDYLVYPIIFLYRHHIELALKNLVTLVADWLDHELSEAEKRHLDGHRLDLLW